MNSHLITLTQITPTAALSGLQTLLNAHQEYSRIRETEQTKREAIKAWRDVEINRSNQQIELLKIYLKESFAERRQMIDGLFDTLNRGIEMNNDTAIQMAVSGLINLVQTSPLSSLDKYIESLNNKKSQHIEI